MPARLRLPAPGQRCRLITPAAAFDYGYHVAALRYVISLLPPLRRLMLR